MSASAQFPKESGSDGSFQWQESAFRRWVRADGSSEFPAAAGRYHLYVSLACPWAHRILIAHRLLGLEEAISLSVVDPERDERGWRFTEGRGHGPDPVEGFEFLSEAYAASDPSFDGRVTVPVLWDRESRQIVNNESSELLRMLPAEFRELARTPLDLFPEALREDIDAVNADVYDHVNNGVYKAGFAASQDAYLTAYGELFDALDRLDARLATSRYLCGPEITEADWRLFTTLIRFDHVYHTHFKCNAKAIAQYEHLSPYLRDLYQQPGVADTVNLDHIKRHYYRTHAQLNPALLVPPGPEPAWDRPHGRERLTS
jgi:glutathionyl-hydroquinone reductase